MTTHSAVSHFGPAPKTGRGPIAALADFFRLFGASIRAARDYERLSALSDAALAARGLTRAELPQAIFRRHLDV